MNAPPSDPARKGGRIPELDGLRGLAILLVLLWHCVGAYLDLEKAWSGPILGVLNLAWTGVDLFFVLSGFLIGGILLDHRAAPNFFKVFYLRRTLRIFPIYFCLLAAFWIARSAGLPGRFPGLEEMFGHGPPLMAYATFTQNFFFAAAGEGGPKALAATWSLAVEEQFYLGLPFVVFLVPRARLGIVLAALALAAPLFRIMMFDLPPRPGYADYLLMPARADALLLGALGAWLIRQEAGRAWLETNRRTVYLCLGALFLGVAVLHQVRISYIDFWMMAVGYTWIALFYFALMMTAVTGRSGWVSFLLRRASLRALGKISYGVYLIHMIVPALAHAILLNQAPVLRTWTDAWVTLGAVAATLGLAALSWRFFERPLIERGHAISYETPAGSPGSLALQGR